MQITGPVLEETHYYPYGLTMAGISTTAPLKLENRFKYNGKELNHQEFSDGNGLEWYSYGDREFDPQLGRFHTLDPYAHIAPGISPYLYALNDPTLLIDINGDSTVPKNDVDWGSFDTQNNTIGLGEVVVTEPWFFYGSYDPLYTGAFLGPTNYIKDEGGQSNVAIAKDNYNEQSDKIASTRTNSHTCDYCLGGAGEYGPWNPDAMGITINYGGALFGGYNIALSFGFVGNRFGVWFTPSASAGFFGGPGISLFAADYVGGTPINPNSEDFFKSFMGASYNVNGGVLMNFGYGGDYSKEAETGKDKLGVVWRIYSIGIGTGIEGDWGSSIPLFNFKY